MFGTNVRKTVSTILLFFKAVCYTYCNYTCRWTTWNDFEIWTLYPYRYRVPTKRHNGRRNIWSLFQA